MGGGTRIGRVRHHRQRGLSPRGRGNRPRSWDNVATIGSIPAWAGEPMSRVFKILIRTVYPRVGGGTSALFFATITVGGLSPRGRGNLSLPTLPVWPLRSIPAWAGEPAAGGLSLLLLWVYPRVGGGTFICSLSQTYLQGLSPRGRGNLHAGRRSCPGWGSIPAWAGEPPFSKYWPTYIITSFASGT